MKQLIILLLITTFISCGNGNVSISKEEYNKLKGIPPKRQFKVDGKTYTIFSGSDGHEYYEVWFYNTGYLHYPGCLLCKSFTH